MPLPIDFAQAARQCVRVLCDPDQVAGALALGFIDAALAYRIFRHLIVNLRRRARGLEQLSFASTRARVKLLDADAPERVVADRKLRRQMDWEREQAAHETARFSKIGT